MHCHSTHLRAIFGKKNQKIGKFKEEKVIIGFQNMGTKRLLIICLGIVWLYSLRVGSMVSKELPKISF